MLFYVQSEKFRFMYLKSKRKGDTAMTNTLVVGADQKPNPEQLLEMYEKLDKQTQEIRAQMKRGALTPCHVQALIEHRNSFPVNPEISGLEGMHKAPAWGFQGDKGKIEVNP